MSSPALDPFAFVCICHFHSVPSRYVPQASDDPRRACRTRSAFHLPPAEAFSRTLVPWISKRSGDFPTVGFENRQVSAERRRLVVAPKFTGRLFSLPFRIEFRLFATLFAQHWLKINVWHVFPCPTRRPPCRGNPLTLATTFLRRRYCLCSIPPFGWNLIFVSSDCPINRTSYLSGHAGGERDLWVTLVAAHPYEADVGS